MNLKRTLLVLITVTVSLVMVSLSTTVQAQRKILQLPELAGYLTLKGDFHMHTVFSDGVTKPVDLNDLTFTVDNYMCGESKRARITLGPATATTR